MIYRFLADSVLIVHLLFIGFVIFGGLVALRSPWIALVHLPALKILEAEHRVAKIFSPR